MEILLQILQSSQSTRLLPQAIPILHRLISHAAIPNSPEGLASALKILEATANGNDEVQLRGLQCVMPLLTHYECHDTILYKAYEVCFRMVANRSVTVVNAAIAIIRQLIIWLFERVIEEETETNDMLYAVQKDNGELLRLRPFAADAFVILQDICLLVNDEKALVLPMSALNKSFALELIESVLAYNSIVFRRQKEFAQMVKDKLCPLMIRKLSESNDFASTCRLWRVVGILVKEFIEVVPIEVEILLSMIVKVFDERTLNWERALAIELLKEVVGDYQLCCHIVKMIENPKLLVSILTELSNACILIITKLSNISLVFTLAQLKVPLLQQFEKNSSPNITDAQLLFGAFDCISQFLVCQEPENPNEMFKQLFEDGWAPIHKALILVLASCRLDSGWRNFVLRSCSLLVGIVANFEIHSAVDSTLLSLSEIALPQYQQASAKSPASMGSLIVNELNLTTSVAILHMALVLGEKLDESWGRIMHVIHGNDQFNILKAKKPSQEGLQGGGSPTGRGPVPIVNKIELEKFEEIADLERRIMEQSRELSLVAFKYFLAALCHLSAETISISTTAGLSNQPSASGTILMGMNNIKLTMVLFPVQKIKQVALLNVTRFIRTDEQILDEIWGILIEQLSQITSSNDVSLRGLGCESVNLLLTQLTSSVDPVVNFRDYPQLQSRIFLPLERILKSTEWLDVHKTVLEVLHRLVQFIGPQITASWPTIFSILKIALIDDGTPLVRNAFASAKLISGEFLSNLEEDCLNELIDILTRFAQITIDLNISLTAIGLLWDVADHIRQRSADLFHLWISIQKKFVLLSIDHRPDVRNSAIQTMIRAIDIGGDAFDLPKWEQICKEAIIPTLDQVPKASLVNDDNNKDSMPISELTHHSRDTMEKQWDETQKYLIEGITSLYDRFLPILRTVDGFEDEEWTKLALLFLEYSKRAKSAELVTISISSLSKLADSCLGDNISIWKKTWQCWREIGFAMSSCEPSCRAFTQDSLLKFVKTFSSLLESYDGQDEGWLQSSMQVIDLALKCPTPSDHIRDIDNPTELQLTVLSLLDRLSNARSLYLVHLSNWLNWLREYPDITMTRTNSVRRSRISTGQSFSSSPKSLITGATTFIALSVTTIERIKMRFEEWSNDQQIYDSGAVEFVIRNLGRLTISKYKLPSGSGPVSVWKLATKTLHNILRLAMSKSFARPLWSIVVDIIEKSVEINRTMIPRDIALDQLEADEEFDVSQIGFIRDVLLPLMENTDETLIRRVIVALASSSKLYITDLNGEYPPDRDECPSSIDGVMDIKPVIKEKYAIACLFSLFTICSDRNMNRRPTRTMEMTSNSPHSVMPLSIRRVTLPILLDRSKSVLSRYAADRVLLGRMPFPRIRQDEIMYILQELNTLVLPSDPVETIELTPRQKLLNGKRGHLFCLYPQYIECLRVDSQIILELIQKAFALMGLELGLIPLS